MSQESAKDMNSVAASFYIDLNIQSKIGLIQTLGTKGSQPRRGIEWKKTYSIKIKGWVNHV